MACCASQSDQRLRGCTLKMNHIAIHPGTSSMFSYSKQSLKAVDPDLWTVVQQEHQRQEQHIELIASENYTSPAVMAAQGSQLTNKYAEGYPGRRYYGGCEHVDVAEQLAIDRVKQIFGADAANVQPHCGASANEAVFLAFLKP